MGVPAKNSVKEFEENGYYHLYNRGVEKRRIFLDDQDYAVFFSYLKFYLSPPDIDSEKVSPSRFLKNYFDCIDLLAYCLMPNHFHFLIRQHQIRAMTDFVRSLLTRYSMYFNKKYKRVGSLFQGRYKAVKVNSEGQLVYLSKYIHRNPATSPTGILDSRYSSLANYLGKRKQNWLQHGPITELFSKIKNDLSYQAFIYENGEVGNIEALLIDATGTDPEGDI